MLLKNGQAVLLFPEGTRSKTGEIGNARPGVGMLACKAGVPVVPVFIMNTNNMGRFKKLKICFGAPMWPDGAGGDKEIYQTFSRAVIAAVADLRAKVYNQ